MKVKRSPARQSTRAKRLLNQKNNVKYVNVSAAVILYIWPYFDNSVKSQHGGLKALDWFNFRVESIKNAYKAAKADTPSQKKRVPGNCYWS